MNVGDDVVIAGKIRAYSKSLGLLVVELPNKEIISVSDKAIKSYRPAIKVDGEDKRKGNLMTDKEKAIVMAHTGICMLTGDKFQIFHKYVEDIMGRPIMTHEIGFLADAIKEKSKTDFIALCADESNSENPKIGRWIPIDDFPYEVWECDHCGFVIDGSGCIEPTEYRDMYNYCPNCGADMRGEHE